MKTLTIAASMLIFSLLQSCTPVFASTIDFKLELSYSADSFEFDEQTAIDEGCNPNALYDANDEPQCIIEKMIDSAELPVKVALGDALFLISKEGVVELGASVGDHDASAETSLQLPVDEDYNLMPFSHPMILNVSGGDHASGMWSFSGTLKIIVQP